MGDVGTDGCVRERWAEGHLIMDFDAISIGGALAR
jgi:hypothetical protein